MARYGRDYNRRSYSDRYDEDPGYRSGWGMSGLSNRFFRGGYDRPYRNRAIGTPGYWGGEERTPGMSSRPYDAGIGLSRYDRDVRGYDRPFARQRRGSFGAYGRRSGRYDRDWF